MAMVINTNISSLNAQRQLAGSANKLGTAMERLSSGLRINSAKDDAAGLAISSRMTTQITGLNVAQRNANDGISLAQTAEGALSTIGNNLQRIRELAVQSRNATNSTDDRAALQKEVVQLKEEIDRVAKNTSFNGTSLLDGSFTAKEFQVGANQGQTIKIDSIQNASIDALGSWDSVAEKEYSRAASSAPAFTGQQAKDGGGFTINGVEIRIDPNAARVDGAAGLTDLVAAFSAAKALDSNKDALEGITMASTGIITVANAPRDAVISNVQNMTAPTLGGLTVTNKAGTGVPKTGFKDLSVETAEQADNAILAMDAALKTVNSARADLGAIQNRFESVVSNLATTSENLTASRSRIQDADFATETANLSSAQVLQQAGTAMLAQANQLPQNVLSLLR
ncbi:flagellin [Comamonas jiangduensis]|uniref:flagellin n=1 Tax=Comamonas jiangduensis TaxID=1194168 RepID=UPI003BF87556